MASTEGRSILESALYEQLFAETVLPQQELILNPTKAENKHAYSLVTHIVSCIEPELRAKKSTKYIDYLSKMYSSAL